MALQKISPFLWFDQQAEEAANFYASVFPNSKVLRVVRRTESAPGHAGSVLIVDFELDGQKFVALNGGPAHQFNEAVSFVVNCESQQEVDDYWTKLSAGGKEIACSWLKDKYGLCWQIVPTALMRLLGDSDRAKADRVMSAMMKMVKIDISELEKAAARK